ncbi:hypothetical protein PSDT_0012 [Parascardovia denticolens DSM 10105 = JCM 12538]|nr:hypothetical protein PSDT_0012 [Parascardovia denticolens DSM 10105 = JCM 12538]
MPASFFHFTFHRPDARTQASRASPLISPPPVLLIGPSRLRREGIEKADCRGMGLKAHPPVAQPEA